MCTAFLQLFAGEASPLQPKRGKTRRVPQLVNRVKPPVSWRFPCRYYRSIFHPIKPGLGWFTLHPVIAVLPCWTTKIAKVRQHLSPVLVNFTCLRVMVKAWSVSWPVHSRAAMDRDGWARFLLPPDHFTRRFSGGTNNLVVLDAMVSCQMINMR